MKKITLSLLVCCLLVLVLINQSFMIDASEVDDCHLDDNTCENSIRDESEPLVNLNDKSEILDILR